VPRPHPRSPLIRPTKSAITSSGTRTVPSHTYLAEAAEITLNITGLGVRALTRATQGGNPHSTPSFLLPNDADRVWWKAHNRQHVRVELLAIGGTLPPPVAPAQPPVAPLPTPVHPPAPPRTATQPRAAHLASGDGATWAGSVLCIGLDIGWFGGSAADRDSQYDCLAWALINRSPDQPFSLTAHLERIALHDRDPDASQLLRAVGALLERHSAAGRVVFAIDAPIQAAHRPGLPVRTALPPGGTIERRACEEYLSHERQRIDRAAGGANDWHPNVQPGAPLAPRVMSLLSGLDRLGFRLWTEADRAAPRLVIECFPAEAIWAMKRLNRFGATLTAAEVKCYKDQDRNTLSALQVAELTRTVLNGFAADSGHPEVWTVLVERAVDWMCSDATWRRAPDQYRGGKLLDDVVDSMICLATSLSYTQGQHHVWQDPIHTDDGHIIGPGKLDALL
jgi:Protein of unknown function (DUF429)